MVLFGPEFQRGYSVEKEDSPFQFAMLYHSLTDGAKGRKNLLKTLNLNVTFNTMT